MAGFLGIFIGIIAILLGTFYQYSLKDQLFLLGITRPIQKIEEFPGFECRKIEHDLLRGCEDLWLDFEERRLFAACGDLEGRTAWTPGGSAINATGRQLTDHFTILDLTSSSKDFNPIPLTITGNYKSATGGKDIDLHGFDVEIINESKLRFWVVNHRPPHDPVTGEALDSLKFGANSTIEVFELDRTKGTELRWVETIFRPGVVETPNDLAAIGDGGFLVSNDHYAKVGLRRELGPLIGGGSLAYHSPTGDTQILTPIPAPHTTLGKFYGPNGVIRGRDNLYYLSETGAGCIYVYTLQPSTSTSPAILTQIDTISTTYPSDNLSIDSEGTIWVAAFPDTIKLMKGMSSPRGTVDAPSTVLSVKKVGEGKGNAGVRKGYVVEKVLEDGEGKTLPLGTVVINDVVGGRLFVTSIMGGFIAVCERKG